MEKNSKEGIFFKSEISNQVLRKNFANELDILFQINTNELFYIMINLVYVL